MVDLKEIYIYLNRSWEETSIYNGSNVDQISEEKHTPYLFKILKKIGMWVISFMFSSNVGLQSHTCISNVSLSSMSLFTIFLLKRKLFIHIRLLYLWHICHVTSTSTRHTTKSPPNQKDFWYKDLVPSLGPLSLIPLMGHENGGASLLN